MSNKTERDEVSGMDTTGHEWDGLKELDTPLPRWWLYVFYASIVAAIIYWILMPAWPMANGYTHGLLNWSDRRNVAAEVQTLRAARAPMFERLANASTADLSRDPELQEFARAAGESAFGDNCQTRVWACRFPQPQGMAALEVVRCALSPAIARLLITCVALRHERHASPSQHPRQTAILG